MGTKWEQKAKSEARMETKWKQEPKHFGILVLTVFPLCSLFVPILVLLCFYFSSSLSHLTVLVLASLSVIIALSVHSSPLWSSSSHFVPTLFPFLSHFFRVLVPNLFRFLCHFGELGPLFSRFVRAWTLFLFLFHF